MKIYKLTVKFGATYFVTCEPDHIDELISFIGNDLLDCEEL